MMMMMMMMTKGVRFTKLFYSEMYPRNCVLTVGYCWKNSGGLQRKSTKDAS